MSVILTSGKKPAKKLQKVKVAKKPHKSHSTATFDAYLPSPNTVVWNHKLDGQQLSIAFCKDTVTIWCNDVLMNADGDFIENGSELNFILYEHKAQIRIRSRRSHSPSQPATEDEAHSPSDSGGGATLSFSNPHGGSTGYGGGGGGNGGVVGELIDSFNGIMTGATSGAAAAAVGRKASASGGDTLLPAESPRSLVYELRVDGQLIPEHKLQQNAQRQHRHRGPLRNESTSSIGSSGSFSSQ